MKRVPAVGNPNADIMIVGESPGGTEVRVGKPFVGPAGKSFDIYLGKAGLDRKDLWITNSIKVEPKGNKTKFFFKVPWREPSEIFSAGIAELKGEIDRVRPNVIVPMGNYALWALTGKRGITTWRGSVLYGKGPAYSHKVLPTIHPAYVLRGNPYDAPLIVWDLCKVRKESASPTIDNPIRQLVVNPSGAEIEQAVERLAAAPVIAFDIECSPEQLQCISFSDDPGWSISIPSSTPGAMDAYREILGRPQRKIGQNVMFDIQYLRALGIEVVTEHEGERLIEDTMVGFYVTWPSPGKATLRPNLAVMTSIYTDEPYYKEDLKISSETNDRRLFWEYNAKDSAVTLEVWQGIENDFRRFKTRRAYDLNMKAFNPLAAHASKGLRADRARFDTIVGDRNLKITRLQRLLEEAAGWKPNVNSDKDVAILVYDQMMLKERAGRSTRQQVLMDIAAKMSDEDIQAILKTIITIRQNRKALSSYLNESLFSADGRIRTFWNLAGTESGRLSSSHSEYLDAHLAIQTAPDYLREIVIPDPGCVFVAPDLSQAESRVVAYLANDHEAIDAYEEGIDAHRATASFVFSVPIEDVTPEQRYIGKRCNHAFNYRMGWMTFMYTVNKDWIDTGIGITAAEAKQYRSAHLALHAALPMWWEEIKAEVRKRGTLTNPLGRSRFFREVEFWSDKIWSEIVSWTPQSTVSDVNKTGLARIHERLPEVEIFADMHDGALLQVSEDRLDALLPEIKDCLTVEIPGLPTIPVEIKVGQRWSEMEEMSV